MNIDTRTLLQEIDSIEADMRSLEGRLTGLRRRIHDGRRDVGLDGHPVRRDASGAMLVGDHSACCGEPTR